jgi:cyclophilin family peptidyl-prolyl cis-trans isomerase
MPTHSAIVVFSLVSAALLGATSANPLFDPAAPFWAEQAPELYRVRFTTSEGVFVVEVRRDQAPIGVDRFYNFVRAGFYNDSRFFRVREGYIAQFGIAGDPALSSIWSDREIADDPVEASNTRGSFAYAMTGPDTRTTQIYINLVDNTHLDEQGFAPLGEVVEGMDVVDHLYAGYGESAGGGMRLGQQGRMFEEGNDHLDRSYPLLTELVDAEIE